MQELIVAVIVGFAAWVIAKRYVPKAVRQIFYQWLLLALGWMGLNGMAARLKRYTQTASAASQGCGGCSGCSSGCEMPASLVRASTAPDALKNTISR